MHIKVESHFLDIQDRIKDVLQEANHVIRIAVAWFTDDILFNILVEKARSGVQVELVLSNVENSGSSYLNFNLLRNAGGEVYRHGESFFGAGGIMHNKFCIVDYDTVITGSYNWTRQAKHNEENISIIRDFQQASLFHDKFIALLSEATPFNHDSSVNFPIITFTTTRHLVDANTTFELHWHVLNADEVEIEGYGIQPNSGNKLLSIEEDTWFTITAVNNKTLESKKKKVLIKVIREPELNYQLSYLDPYTRQRLPLNPITGTIYSVPETIPVWISWETKFAERFTITGFDSLDKSGELLLPGSGTAQIELKALGIKHTIKEGIVINRFKLPVLTHIQTPLLGEVNLDIKINFERTIVPSSLSLSAQVFEARVPRVAELKNTINDNEPKLSDIARQQQVSVNHLRRELHQYQKSKSNVLYFLKEKFSENTFISSILKNI